MGYAYDFSGWATKNNIRCSDGRMIRQDAFKEQSGQKVPLVWQHQHNDPSNVLGHALLENRPEGVYAYCTFNDSPKGRQTKTLVEHGDVVALSIYANKLKQQGGNVLHGVIREVSVVLAGANPGALIDFPVLEHGDDVIAIEDEATIYTGESIELYHSDTQKEPELEDEPSEEEEKPSEKKEVKEVKNENNIKEDNNMNEDKTIKEVFDSLTDEQKNVVYFLIGQAVEDATADVDEDDDDEAAEHYDFGGDYMKHNVFEDYDDPGCAPLTVDDMDTILDDAKRLGSLKESVLQHMEDGVLAHADMQPQYGIDNVDYLFPEARALGGTPEFIKRDTNWVKDVMTGVHHSPFSRIKSIFANISEDEARAKGFIKGNMKKDQVFTLLKRTTAPTTVYKKQKMDRDDVIDITDFDVIAWLKSEMREMLDEELARAILVSDGRSASDDDKINEVNIRPIWKDDDLYTIKQAVTVAANATDDDIAKAMIKQSVKARKNYKGSGNPTLFTTEDFLTSMLLLEDTQGHRIYKSEAELATAMRVKNIVTVPVMENLTRVDANSNTRTLMGIIVNLTDYNVGADKGGAVNMFDDFDIDYNQQKYLIETRCSGALIKPYSAIALEKVISA